MQELLRAIVVLVLSFPAEECRELSDPPFGTVSITGRTPSSTGTYQCNTGFLLVGQQTRTCVQETEDTADWSGEEPVCQRSYIICLSCIHV